MVRCPLESRRPRSSRWGVKSRSRDHSKASATSPTRVRVGLRTREPRVGELESSKRPFVDKSDEIRPEERHISGTSPHEDSAIACLSEAFDSAFDRNAYDLSARHGHGLDPIAPYVSRFNCRLMDSILGRLIEPLPDYGPIVLDTHENDSSTRVTKGDKGLLDGDSAEPGL